VTAPRFVDKLSSRMSPHISRRGFFARTAVVGSALAVAPVDYVIKPGTAYAAVCNYSGQNCDCGAMCGDGYTEFCCTIYGNNQCPPGTALGGWWKADGTGLCGGPRYYMDCNANCNGCGCGGNGVCSGSCARASCGCANGDCNNRHAGCTQFRYGQCNQGTACLGPIMCRVVTCIPPWQIDATCTTMTLIDQNTAFHDRPCLHRTIGSFDSATDGGGAVRVTGWALDFDTSASINVHVYVDGAFAGQYLANSSRPDIGNVYPGMGAAHGFDVLVPAGPGNHSVDVYAINAGPAGPGAANPLLGTRQVTIASPFGRLDLVSGGLKAIRVAGWVIDPDTAAPVDVHVYVDGVGIGAFTANGSRPDIGAAYPAAGPNHGFDVTFPTTTGTHTVTVYGINVGGGGNTVLGTRVVEVNPNPIGNLELVSPQSGQVRAVGWAIDPDTTGPITVHAYVDGVLVQQALANQSRPDVGTAFPGFGPNHGFDLLLPAADGVHTVEVYGINVGGGSVNSLLGRRTVTVQHAPFGNVEIVSPQVGQIRVAGWAVDPDSPASIDVHVYVDGVKAGEFTAALARGDIAAAFPTAGPNHGFDVTVPVATGGAHLVHVYAINVGFGTSNPLIGTRGVTTGGNPFGSLDEVTPTAGSLELRGWALDPDSSAPVDVHVYVDGAKVAQTSASLSRPDVAAAFGGAGPNHGYDLTVPVAAGNHTVHVYAINLGTGTANPLIGTRTVTVP
jgi:hypothetical protein